MRTIKELKEKAAQTGRNRWQYSGCPCGCRATYLWHEDSVTYTGVMKDIDLEVSVGASWKKLQKNYNSEIPEAYERHEREWGFIND